MRYLRKPTTLRTLRASHCKNVNRNGLKRYDYETFKRDILRGLPGRPTNMWRYQDVLPLTTPPL
jgi:hypothetical protein